MYEISGYHSGEYDMTAFWDRAARSFIEVDRRFRGTMNKKRRSTSARQHLAIFQKAVIFEFQYNNSRLKME
jgi:hypothetical protein